MKSVPVMSVPGTYPNFETMKCEKETNGMYRGQKLRVHYKVSDSFVPLTQTVAYRATPFAAKNVQITFAISADDGEQVAMVGRIEEPRNLILMSKKTIISSTTTTSTNSKYF